MKRFKKFIKTLVIQGILSTKKFKPTESIIIFSEARGGSTWLMEILSKALNVSIHWEPLHMNKGVVPNTYKFGWRPYIPEENNDKRYYTLFKNIFAFKTHTAWSRRYLGVKQLMQSDYVLVKFVRANLLIPYILKNFNFKFKPIVLIRQPIDTCLSQIRAFDSNETSSKVEIPNWINNERFVTHIDFLKQLKTPLELKIANWCLNNCQTLNTLDTSKVHVVFYSDLVSQPKQEIKTILEAYDHNDYDAVLDTIDYRKASATIKGNEFKASIEEQLHKNFNKLDKATKDNIQKIFDYFDFKLYSAYSPLPNKNSLL